MTLHGVGTTGLASMAANKHNPLTSRHVLYSMIWWTILLMLCMIPLAFGQTDQTRFFIITELGNTFEIAGPPPDRLPGFDSAPYLNMHKLDTALSLTAGGTTFEPPVATFGQAGSVTQLPDHDTHRSSMSAMLVTNWGAGSWPLYAHFPTGELRMDGSTPYLGPGVVGNSSTTDIIRLCNMNGTGVSCVNNYAGRDIRGNPSGDNGYVLNLAPAGRTIIHVKNITHVTGSHLEVFFTCPDCRDEAKAYYGWGGKEFVERGFNHTITTTPTPGPPVQFGPGNLGGLAWDNVRDANDITYWQEGDGSCPTLSILGSNILGACSDLGTYPLQAGTVEAQIWQPLTPGWNSIPQASYSYIVVMDPGYDAKLQIRGGTERCCEGFDGGITNRAGKAAVVHDTDRHLLIIPNRGHIPFDHPALNEMHHLRWETRQDYQGMPRWLSHSEYGDPIYHGLLYDGRGVWPPYQVRTVDAETISFRPPAANILDYIAGSNYTDDDLQYVLTIGGAHTGLLDSQIYDMRNDVRLRTEKGTFKMWDGTHVDRVYILPWMAVQKNPVWELYGVALPKDKMLIVDMYATIPIVKPTHLSDSYLSSIPCGYPGGDDMSDLRGALMAAIASREYDDSLVRFLLYTNWGADIQDSMILQHIYQASRTYLDYLDGAYLDGENVYTYRCCPTARTFAPS